MMEKTNSKPLTFVWGSVGFVFKLFLLLGLIILATFIAHLILPETFGIFKETRIAFAAVGAVAALNYILTHFYPKYILWSLGVVWALDVLLVVVLVLRQ